MAHNSRDLELPAWGPYSKHYAGISRILSESTAVATSDGAMIDFVPLIGHIRGRVIVPDVNFESGYHHWDATSDLSYIAYRYQLQWKDIEYADVEFFAHDTESHLAKITLVNNTDYPKEYVAALFAVLRIYRKVSLHLEQGELWIGGENYTSLDYASPEDVWADSENYEFNPVSLYLESGKHGLRQGVIVSDFLVDKAGLGNLITPYAQRLKGVRRGNRTFLLRPGTAMRFDIPAARPYRRLYLRCAMAGVRTLKLTVETDTQTVDVVVEGPAASAAIDFEDLRLIAVDLPRPEQTHSVTLRVAYVALARETQSFVLDGLLLTDADGEQAASKFAMDDAAPRFSIRRATPHKGVTFACETFPVSAGLYAADERPVPPPPYNDCTIPSIYHSQISSTEILRRLNNDALTNWYSNNIILWGDYGNHFAGYSLSPIVVPAHGSRSVFVALVCGDVADPRGRAEDVFGKRLEIEQRTRSQISASRALERQAPFGQAMERTQLFTNVIYPEQLGLEFVKTYVPGKRFPAFITWDSGMHGIGLMEYAPDRALDIVNQAMAFDGEPGVMATLNGTPLPLHIYLLNEIYLQTHDLAMLAAYYPRARAYQRFFSGQSPQSPFDTFQNGLLNPFCEKHNSMGIDDYPAQHYVHQMGLDGRVAPAGTTAHAIRACKLMQLFAHLLDRSDEVADLEQWIAYLSEPLQRYAWHEPSGYYAYVDNDTKRPLLYELSDNFADPANFNMGLDGVAPLVSGICTPDQRERLIEHLMTPGEMWTEYGITAVAQNAPYYRSDGYWVGKVWIPHQWFMWKALIGEAALAHAERIARTALRVWADATDTTYNVWETFDAHTGQGEGAHQFAGLSGPVAQLYHRYFTPGRVTGGFDTLIHGVDFSARANVLEAHLSAPFRAGPTGLVGVMAKPGRYRIAINGQVWDQIAPEGWLNLQLILGADSQRIVVREAND